MCIFLKKREQGKGGGEAYFHVVHGRKDGTGLGRGRDPAGGEGEGTPERTARVSRLGHKTQQPGRSRVRGPLKSLVAHYNQLRAKENQNNTKR